MFHAIIEEAVGSERSYRIVIVGRAFFLHELLQRTHRKSRVDLPARFRSDEFEFGECKFAIVRTQLFLRIYRTEFDRDSYARKRQSAQENTKKEPRLDQTGCLQTSRIRKYEQHGGTRETWKTCRLSRFGIEEGMLNENTVFAIFRFRNYLDK